MHKQTDFTDQIQKPPQGLAVLTLVGPSFVWCAEYIGSGEVILATRTGAILGPGILWAIVFAVFLKYWIGLSGARYTVCTGEGMIDLFNRMPGPRSWAVWITLVAQFISATIAIGSLATAAGVFISALLPVSPVAGGWLVTVFALGVAWSGTFGILKMVMSFLVMVILLGVVYVTAGVFPGVSAVLRGLLPQIPDVPAWALQSGKVSANAWHEILPLLGWAAGGFASQVWYSYWVLSAGYGAAAEGKAGKPADDSFLAAMSAKTARRIKGWLRVVYVDATLAMVIGVFVTACFALAGAGVLAPRHLAPDGAQVALQLSTLFSAQWGLAGGYLFLLAGSAALISTQVGQLAGWPRLLADAFRICIPGFGRWEWKKQFRAFLLFFFITNMTIVYTFGLKPVILIKVAAVLDGLLLTPMQALILAVGLYSILPRMLSEEARRVLRPGWMFAVGLIVAFLVFGYFCVFQIPSVL
ncbi:Nramp family divalent metal transporter [bacterium]|nr:Nramp family divalent metal transporter [bacterium]